MMRRTPDTRWVVHIAVRCANCGEPGASSSQTSERCRRCGKPGSTNEVAVPTAGGSGDRRRGLRLARDRLRARQTWAFYAVVGALTAASAVVAVRVAALPAWVVAVGAASGPLVAWAVGLLAALRRLDIPRVPRAR